MKRPVLCLCLALACGACKSHSNGATTQPVASASVSNSARVAPRPPILLASIPTEEDYEDEAEQQITSQNLESELDKLEKELKNP